jgi:TRAP-type C4-dicarboxylate transport system permease small subunit
MSIKETLADAARNTDKKTKWFARLYFISIFIILALATSILVYFNYISFNLSVTANISIGWIVEILLGSFVGMFVLFSGAMMLKATGAKTIKAMVSVIARIADNYTLDDVKNNDS